MHFNCARATKVLTRIEKTEARIAAGLPKLRAAEAKATTDGTTARAARLENRIDRLDSTTLHDPSDQGVGAIEAKCNVPAPTVAPASSTTLRPDRSAPGRTATRWSAAGKVVDQRVGQVGEAGGQLGRRTGWLLSAARSA